MKDQPRGCVEGERSRSLNSTEPFSGEDWVLCMEFQRRKAWWTGKCRVTRDGVVRGQEAKTGLEGLDGDVKLIPSRMS